MEDNKKFCKFCGELIDKDNIICPKCGRQIKLIEKEKIQIENTVEEPQYDETSKFYSQVWFMWLMIIFFPPVGIFLMWKFHNEMNKNTKIALTVTFSLFFLIIISAINSNKKTTTNNNSNSTSINNTTSNKVNNIEVIDFSNMQENDISAWCKEKNLDCVFEKEYSDSIAKDGFIKQSVKATEQVPEGSKITVTYSLGKEPTAEQKSALKSAETYAKTMHMSKKKIYEQLTSQYGEKFDANAAQYAVDNIECDWNENALETAKNYRNTMSMSKQKIYDQLISNYGEKFTKDEAKYAIDHLDD